MRCDKPSDPMLIDTNVSIHTPTWGVTKLMQYLRCGNSFQSTHLHEVWLRYGKTLVLLIGFNPHTYMRCDIIHYLTLSIVIGFNPHTYMRCDLFRFLCILMVIMFQSTHLHEVWLTSIRGVLQLFSFNPHTYMRCDLTLLCLIVFFKCFNPHTYMRCDLRGQNQNN